MNSKIEFCLLCLSKIRQVENDDFLGLIPYMESLKISLREIRHEARNSGRTELHHTAGLLHDAALFTPPELLTLTEILDVFQEALETLQKNEDPRVQLRSKLIQAGAHLVPDEVSQSKARRDLIEKLLLEELTSVENSALEKKHKDKALKVVQKILFSWREQVLTSWRESNT